MNVPSLLRLLISGLLLLPVLSAATLSRSGQTPSNQPPSNQTPANTSPSNEAPSAPAKPIAPDPAAVTFSTEVGMLLVAVKPTMVAQYEAAITALQDALSKATDEDTRELAKGWRVYKVNELDAKANPLYVHLIQPTRPTADYRPSILLDKLLSGAPADLLAKYRDSFAAPPSKLALQEFAHMAVAPVPKPTNTSPDAPADADKPVNATTKKPKPPAQP